MSVPRFFCDRPLAPTDVGHEIELSAATARHAAQVLRLRTGDRVVVFTGQGGEFAATIGRIDKRGVAASIDGYDPVEREAPESVTLVQSVVAADMMDMIVRRAVELGAAAIVPVVAARSQRIPEDRAARRTAHWRRIAIAACEQCGRNRIPPIADLQPLAQWLDTPSTFGGDAIILVPQASDALAAMVRNAAPRAVLIGPEGGFIAEEVELAVRLGVRRAQLGPRVLRAETAALAALATIDAAAAGRAGLTPRPIDATIHSR